MDLTSQIWFGWSLGLIIALPVLLVALSELVLVLQRRGNSLAGPVNRLRLLLLPLAALLFLLTRAAELDEQNTGVRVVATLVGILAVTITLGGLNAVLFGNATRGTWRERLPSIFVDLARLVLVLTGAAIVASYVWGLDVGGLFAALGVGSIVIGLALQNAIGSVVSGLLLLFEQPFRTGDLLDVNGVSGRVVEVNWRSTHLDTGAGIQVIPNASLAAASFANLSLPTPAHDLVVPTAFAPADDPVSVSSVLLEVAGRLTLLRPDAVPSVQSSGGGAYETKIPLVTADDSAEARSRFLIWLWYAAQRAGLTLDENPPSPSAPEQVAAALGRVTETLPMTQQELEAVAGASRLEVYAVGEIVLPYGAVPEALGYLVSGRLQLAVPHPGGGLVPAAELLPGEPFGETVASRSPARSSAVALSKVEVLQVPRDALDRLILVNRAVAKRLTGLDAVRARQVDQAFS